MRIKLFITAFCLCVPIFFATCLFAFQASAIESTEEIGFSLSPDDIESWNIVDGYAEMPPALLIRVNENIRKDFFEITSQNIGKRLILTINNKKVSSAIIREPINSGNFMVSPIKDETLLDFLPPDKRIDTSNDQK